MHAAKFVDSYLDAWNHHSSKAVADHLAQNGVYCDIPEHAERDHDQLVASLDDFFARFHHRYELEGEAVVNRTAIAFQYRMIPEHGTGGGIYRGAEFITLGDDGALVIRDYYELPRKVLHTQSASIGKTPPAREKYRKSGLDDQRLRRLRHDLESLMVDGQVYLQPDLTLPRLADRLGCSVNHLSQVINAGFGVNFFEYVNRHRVEHACTLLASADSGDVPITGIAYSVGFNANSAFYAAFRKHVGVTPDRYRRRAAGRRCSGLSD
jgi:AraC-like DNA-binding protein